MRTDSRLSRMLHVLLHMEGREAPMTSEQIAAMLGAQAAVVRRTMAGLREAGYVRSEKGHGGGWRLACDLKQVTLLDILRAVGSERLFAIGFDNETPDCLVERVVNASVSGVMDRAEALLIEGLKGVTLADLTDQFRAELGAMTSPAPHD